MTEPNIALIPPDRSKPRRASMPVDRSRRWTSADENEGYVSQLTVFVSPKAYVRFCAHTGSDLENEVGGWLVGKWRADSITGAQFIVVEATLPARFTRQGGTYLTFTQDSQVNLYSELQARFPNKELVGWYHSHPGMGIFLSTYDTWLHQNFFPNAYQVALVIEPYSLKGGFFIRRPDGELDPQHYFGFFELFENRKTSVVHWKNLQSDDGMEPEQGENL